MYAGILANLYPFSYPPFQLFLTWSTSYGRSLMKKEEANWCIQYTLRTNHFHVPAVHIPFYQ